MANTGGLSWLWLASLCRRDFSRCSRERTQFLLEHVFFLNICHTTRPFLGPDRNLPWLLVCWVYKLHPSYHGRYSLLPGSPSFSSSSSFVMPSPSPLTKLAGAFPRSRVELNESTGTPIPKLLTRSLHEVDKISRTGPPFSLSDLVCVLALT